MKAPKFDESPGFVPEENGLWEVKLIVTREGLVFVNFDASTMDLPFNNVKSHVQMESRSWVEGMDVTCAVNWKDLGKWFVLPATQSLTSAQQTIFRARLNGHRTRLGGSLASAGPRWSAFWDLLA